MELVDSGNIPAPPEIPSEIVEVPVLGAVRVRALTLSERLAFRALCAGLGGKEGVQDADVYATVPVLLEKAVVDSASRPVYSKTRWDQYGATHEAAALELFDVAMRLSGLRSDEAKKN